MTIARTIVLNPIEPALLSVRSGLGIDLDLGLTFLSQARTPVDPTPLRAQLVLLPRSGYGMSPYDVTVLSVDGGTASVTVPGVTLIDANGYNLELYQRRAAANPDDPPVAIGLLAKGVLRLEGSAYTSWGPLSPINVPVVVGPAGPPGAQGAASTVPGPAGQRGSIWTTGSGAPAVTGSELSGDMYLDEVTGDVWRFDGAAWARGSF